VSGPSTPAAIDALFKLPLGEFTAARNTLVAQLKKDDKPAAASEVNALTKPSVSAWVVNQLHWRHREAFDRLIEAGKRLRRIHAKQRAGAPAHDPVNARRQVIVELSGVAEQILRDEGYGATRDLLRRVRSTLEAFSSYGSLPGAPVAGRLTDDLEPPGFEAVAGFVPKNENRSKAVPETRRAATTTRRASRAERDEHDRKSVIAAAKTAVREAERALSAARKQSHRAATKLATAAKRATTIERQRERIEKRLARISKHAASARAQASDAASIANEASQTVAGAQRALELARQRLRAAAGTGD